MGRRDVFLSYRPICLRDGLNVVRRIVESSTYSHRESQHHQIQLPLHDVSLDRMLQRLLQLLLPYDQRGRFVRLLLRLYLESFLRVASDLERDRHDAHRTHSGILDRLP